MPDPDTLGQTVLWFERAVPAPTSKNLHTQLGCHFEEVAEMIDVLDSGNPRTNRLLLDAKLALEVLATHLKAYDEVVHVPPHYRADLLDALCDQIVTATGVGHMMGFLIQEAVHVVNLSNWSKFDDNGQPIFDTNRKVQKGPNYFKADLTLFV
jgi:predicted HAD superfamily Cof-like phosphohydrolase